MSNTDDQLVADYLRRLAAAAESLPADRRDELMEEISAHIAEARALGPDASGAATASVADTLTRLGQPDDIVRAAAEQAGTGDLGGSADSALGAGSPAAGGPTGYGPTGHGPTGHSPGGHSPGGHSPGGHSPGGYGPGGYGPTGAYPGWPSSYSPPGPAASGIGVMEICAVILLLVGAALAGVGWIVGVILLWISPRWRLSDKLLGTLIWPGGLAAVLFVLSGAGVFGGTSASACEGGTGSHQTITQHCVNPPGAVPGVLALTILLAAVVVGIGGPVLVAIRLVRQARRAAPLPGRSLSPG